MPAITDRIQTAGAILAVVVSVAALTNSIWSDRQGRQCVFLYEKNDRLIGLSDAFGKVEIGLDAMNEKGGKFLEEIKGSDPNSPEVTKKVQEMLVYALHGRIDAVDELHRLINNHRYVFSTTDMTKIRKKVEDLHARRPANDQHAEFLEFIEARTRELLSDIDTLMDRELDNVANLLRANCSD